ncbi:arylsulfatase [Colwellia piezophila]|uniref:arylsulfatase n=1 Tax=Colwellia piezophila TaxID=211668 RepID=UPI00037DAFF2|nr:arylsulfatase [Colwellia piezophila]
MNKITFLLTSVILLLVTVGHAHAKKQPNVIVIMTDDQGNNLGYLGNPHLKTPNIDKLANESIRFTNFHQENKCTTSRASLMTGKDSFRTGAWRTSKGRSTMRTEEVTLAEAFKAGGYQTGHFGKWHLGEAWPTRPMDQGFDDSVQLKTGGIGQIADYWGNDTMDDTYYHNGVPKKYKGYCTDVFFSETMRFIDEATAKSDKPFFIYLAPNVAHLPFRVEEKYSQPLIDAGVNKKQAIFFGMVHNLDYNVGRLTAYLEKQGLAEDTIILYTTDDGAAGASFIGMGKDHHVTEGWNMGLRGGKGSRYEGGHRVFANMKYPQSGITGDNNTLIAVKDVYPTLLEIAGVDMPKGVKVDGRSFAPFIKKPLDPENDERPIFINYYNPKKWDSNKFSSVTYKNWRLVGGTEFYDIVKDPGQKNDIAKQHPELMERLNAEYKEWDKVAQVHVRNDVVRFILGDKQHPEIVMTGQDHWTNKGCNPFSQGSPRLLQTCNGPLKVNFVNSGSYTVTLSRYPLYTNIPMRVNVRKVYGEKVYKSEFDVKHARLVIGDKEYNKTLKGDEKSVSFDLKLKSGEMDLQSWITGTFLVNGEKKVKFKEGQELIVPGYFVTVKYNG